MGQPLSARSYSQLTSSHSWEEIWEAGPYFDRLSALLESARDYAIIAGWQIDSRVPMSGPDGARETLKQKLLRLVNEKPDFEIYLLMWAHAYFYCFEREVGQAGIWDDLHPRIHFVFDNHHPIGGSHHEKVCIIDGRVALTGGIDVCDERWDTPQHLYEDPRRSLDGKAENHGPYHDVGVQVSGPVVAEIQRHLVRRWQGRSSVPLPEPRAFSAVSASAGHPVYLSRTIARESGIVREIEFLFRDLIRLARRRILLEGQYYWSEDFNDLLISKMHEMRGRDFEITVILADIGEITSLTRKMSRHELQLLEALREAAAFTGVKLTLGHPRVAPPLGNTGPARPVYIHSKVVIIDDEFLSIGSANFADRAFRVDTEVNLTFAARNEAERAHIRRVAAQIVGHWSSHGMRLQPFRPRAELDAAEGPRHFGLQPVFDPSLPWAYGLQRQLRKFEGRRSHLLGIGLGAAAWAGGSLSLVLSGFPEMGWPAVYALSIASAWLVPVPVVALSILASFQLGLVEGSWLAASSAFVAAVTGYLLGRNLPSLANRLNSAPPQELSLRLGRRRFLDLLAASLSPRAGLRSKAMLQGLYGIAFPWFLFSCALVLTAALFVFCRWVLLLLPAEALAAAHSGAPYVAAAILAVSYVKPLVEALWRERHLK